MIVGDNRLILLADNQ